jgi:hypothetical protein
MSSTFSSLKFELIGTGDQTGTWGATTNTNIGTAIEQAIAGMATLTAGNFTTNVATLTLTDTNAAQNARALALVVANGSLSAAGTINVPAVQKPYVIINNDVFDVTVKVSGLTGVLVPAGKRTVVYNNGTDVGEEISYLTALALGTPLPTSSGGTGGSSLTAAQIVTYTGAETLTNKTFTGYTETVYAITDSGSVVINPANGTIQTWTLGANRSPSITMSAGQSLTLMVDDGTAYAVTWPSVTWVGGVAPTLPTTGYGVIVLWKVGTTVYGSYVGAAA